MKLLLFYAALLSCCLNYASDGIKGVDAVGTSQQNNASKLLTMSKLYTRYPIGWGIDRYVPFIRSVISNKTCSSKSQLTTYKDFRRAVPFTAAVALNRYLSTHREYEYDGPSWTETSFVGGCFKRLVFSKEFDASGARKFISTIDYRPDDTLEGPQKSFVDAFNAASGTSFCGKRVLDAYTSCVRKKYEHNPTAFTISCESAIPNELYQAARKKYVKDTGNEIKID